MAKLASPPKRLSPEARREWVRVADHLERSGLLEWADRDALAALCELVARWEAIRKQVRADGGDVIRDAKGRPRMHPLSRESHRLTNQFMRLVDRLGMTPLSRAKIQAARALRDKRIRRQIKLAEG